MTMTLTALRKQLPANIVQEQSADKLKQSLLIIHIVKAIGRSL